MKQHTNNTIVSEKGAKPKILRRVVVNLLDYVDNSIFMGFSKDFADTYHPWSVGVVRRWL